MEKNIEDLVEDELAKAPEEETPIRVEPDPSTDEETPLEKEEEEPMYEPEPPHEETPPRRVSPEAAQALGNRYAEPEYEQPEYGRPPPRRRPPPETGYSEATFMRNLMSGDVGIGEALMIMEYWDRKDRKDNAKPDLTLEDIRKETSTIVAATLKEAGLTGKPREEMPDWAKDIQSNVSSLNKRFEEDEQEKRDKKLVDAVTKPLLADMEKEREKRELLEKKLEELSKPPEQGPPKSELDNYIEYKDKMIKAGFLKEEKGNLTFGPEGIPVDGSIPAWTVYAPTMVDQIFDNIEKRVENIAGVFGVGKKGRDLENLINMPSKPKPKKETPPLRPAEHKPEPPPQPLEETPETLPLDDLTHVEEPAEVEQEQPEELITLPTRKPENILENRVPKPEHPEPEPESTDEPSPESEEEVVELPPSEEETSFTGVDVETLKVTLDPETEEETPPQEEYVCPDCGNSFSSLKSLRGHCGATGHHYPDELRIQKDPEEEET